MKTPRLVTSLTALTRTVVSAALPDGSQGIAGNVEKDEEEPLQLPPIHQSRPPFSSATHRGTTARVRYLAKPDYGLPSRKTDRVRNLLDIREESVDSDNDDSSSVAAGSKQNPLHENCKPPRENCKTLGDWSKTFCDNSKTDNEISLSLNEISESASENIKSHNENSKSLRENSKCTSENSQSENLKSLTENSQTHNGNFKSHNGKSQYYDLPQSHSGKFQSNNETSKSHSETSQSHKGKSQSHKETSKFHNEISQSHNGKSQSHYETSQSHNETSQSHNGKSQTHNENPQSHSGKFQSHNGKSQSHTMYAPSPPRSKLLVSRGEWQKDVRVSLSVLSRHHHLTRWTDPHTTLPARHPPYLKALSQKNFYLGYKDDDDDDDDFPTDIKERRSLSMYSFLPTLPLQANSRHTISMSQPDILKHSYQVASPSDITENRRQRLQRLWQRAGQMLSQPQNEELSNSAVQKPDLIWVPAPGGMFHRPLYSRWPLRRDALAEPERMCLPQPVRERVLRDVEVRRRSVKRRVSQFLTVKLGVNMEEDLIA